MQDEVDYETNYEDDNYGSEDNRNVDINSGGHHQNNNAAPLPISENPQVEYADDNEEYYDDSNYEYEYQDDYDNNQNNNNGASDDVATLPDYEYEEYVDTRSGSGSGSEADDPNADHDSCPGGDLETCQGVCPNDPEVLDLCFTECEERCPKPEPEIDPNADAQQCPGGDLDTCIDVCPGFNKVAFGLCVAECGERCP